MKASGFLLVGLFFVLGCSSSKAVDEVEAISPVSESNNLVIPADDKKKDVINPEEQAPKEASQEVLQPSQNPPLVPERPAPTETSFVAGDFEIEGTQHYAALLKAHVQEGKVRYGAIRMAPSYLDLYLEKLAEVSEEQFQSWPEQKQIAFLINLYNATTLRLIIDHYPLASIRDIGNFLKGPWNQEVVSLFDEKTTLDYVEHQMLRKNYEEPRIHFALVCAAKSCPPLRGEP